MAAAGETREAEDLDATFHIGKVLMAGDREILGDRPPPRTPPRKNKKDREINLISRNVDACWPLASFF